MNEITELFRADFPPLLREINDPPVRLFVRGRLPAQEKDGKNMNDQGKKFLCVIGSRKASTYGVDACRKLIRGLAGQDIVIVSGLALGIDGVAHEAALEAGLQTIAILGSGLAWHAVYPVANLRLAKEIVAAGGALVSEMPEDHRPYKHNFPQRNRIMAGLSHAVLVIEASLKSGTLITARLALDYNRDVFAVPGNIFSEKSAGPHMLISNGALLVRNSDDIIHGLGLKANTDSVSPNSKLLENCTETEKKIYKLLSEPMSRAEILQKFPSSTSDANVALSLLEMKKFIIESDGVLRRA